MSDATSLPGLVLDSMSRDPSRKRILWRDADSVDSLDGDQFLAKASSLARGLARLGVAFGDRVGILAPSSPEWLLFDVAALSLGAVTVPLFANVSKENLSWQIQNSGMKILLAQDRTQALLARSCSGASLRIVALADAGAGDSIAWDDLASEAPELDGFRRNAARIRPDDLATIIYTSGSTGRPKGVVLDHGAMLFQIAGATVRFPLEAEGNLALSCLPFAHVFERIVTYFHLRNGYPLAIAKDVQAVGEDLKVFRPTIFTVVPRLLEKMLDRIEIQARAARGIKLAIARAALREADREPGPLSPIIAPVLDLLAWRRVRAALGGRLKLIVSGGAALPRSVELRMRRMGLPIMEGYGLTEHGPVVSANGLSENRPGSVGRSFPGVETRLQEDGELWVRSRAVFRGYWNRPEESALAHAEDGWLRTGDLARIDDDGYLFLVGRKKDLCKTAGGKYVAPVPIEEALASHELVEHAVVCADGRKFVSAVLAPDFAALRRRAAAAGQSATESDILASPEFAAEIQAHVFAVNARLDEWAKVRRWTVSPHPFRIETGEITPTMKVRRAEVLQRFSDALDAHYR
jgi:long-chain acyl-CoA synthetase